jgi:hypothetical protein
MASAEEVKGSFGGALMIQSLRVMALRASVTRPNPGPFPATMCNPGSQTPGI